MWNAKRCTEILQYPLRKFGRKSKFPRHSFTDIWILAMYSSKGPKKIQKFAFLPEKQINYDKDKAKSKTDEKASKVEESKSKSVDLKNNPEIVKISPVALSSISKVEQKPVVETAPKNIVSPLTNIPAIKLGQKEKPIEQVEMKENQQGMEKTEDNVAFASMASDKEKEKSWRATKYSLITVGFVITTIGSYMYFVLGAPETDKDGNSIQDEELAMLPIWKQYFWRMIKQLSYYDKLLREPSRDKLLPDAVKYPYYQPPYTLVLELTDVLVHPEWSYLTGWRFKKRPGIDEFLESVSGQFEIVIYTAEMGMTVFPIIDALDPKNLISYKLVRDATNFVDGHHVKDLDKLNRDLSKVIVVDWNHNTTKLHRDNLFQIERWSGTDNDNTLYDVAAFLRMVAQWEIDDVREVLRYYGRFENALETFNEKRREMLASVEAS